MTTKRNYKKATAYENTPAQIKHREERNKARYDMKKKLGEKAVAGKDIDHKQKLRAGGSNAPSNWRVRSVHANRSDK